MTCILIIEIKENETHMIMKTQIIQYYQPDLEQILIMWVPSYNVKIKNNMMKKCLTKNL